MCVDFEIASFLQKVTKYWKFTMDSNHFVDFEISIAKCWFLIIFSIVIQIWVKFENLKSKLQVTCDVIYVDTTWLWLI